MENQLTSAAGVIFDVLLLFSQGPPISEAFDPGLRSTIEKR